MKNRIFRTLALVYLISAFFMPACALAEGDELVELPTPTMSEQTLPPEMTVIPLSTPEAKPAPATAPVTPQQPAVHRRDDAGQVAKMDAMPMDDIPDPSPEDVVETPVPTPAETTPEPTPLATPTPVEPPTSTGEKPLTPDGQGTVVDNVTDQDGKEFFTIYTESGNVFYLIIDRQKNSENIYFLNTVTEADLRALAEDGLEEIEPTPEPAPTPKPVRTEPQPTQEPEPEPKKSNSLGTILLLILVAGVAGGVGYYIKIYKPKQEAIYEDDEDYDDYDDELGPDNDEAIDEPTDDEPERIIYEDE